MTPSSEWLEADVPIDPLLRDPLELFGGHCRRRIQVLTLLRMLGFDEHRDVAVSTQRLVFEMLPRLADAVDRRRVDVRARAVEVASGAAAHDRLDRAVVARAMLDFGWGHHEVQGGPVRDVLAELEALYVRLMADRVTQMMRRWEKHGWLSDVAG